MPKQKERKRTVHPLAVGIVILAGLLIVLGPTLLRNLFATRSIDVQGNHYVTDAQVIESSGIRLGDSVLSVNADRVAENIERNRYLDFVGLWRGFFPPSVTITVVEHTPRAKMMWMGMLLIIGENGVVLERTAEIDIPVHVPEVIGMSVSSVTVGEPIHYELAGQGEAVDAVLDALDLQGVTGEVSEINIASPDNLSMISEDGLQVVLGDTDQLPEKIALFRDTLPRVRALHPVRGGILNVSSGVTADYRPPTEYLPKQSNEAYEPLPIAEDTEQETVGSD